MSRTAGLALVAFFAVATTSADAGGWGPPWRTSGYGYSVTYYYPVAVAVVPYYCAPAPVYVRPVPIYGNGYAQPQPAPPSGTGEPPLLKKPMAPPRFSPLLTRMSTVGTQRRMPAAKAKIDTSTLLVNTLVANSADGFSV